MANFLDEMDELAKEAEELSKSRGKGVVTKVTLTRGWHTPIGKNLFEEKGEPYDHKLSWVEVGNGVKSKEAREESLRIGKSMGSNFFPKLAMRVWESRADVLGFDATEKSDKDYYRDRFVYKPDSVEINGEYVDVNEGYDEMMKSLRSYGDQIQSGKPFWAHVISFPVAYNGKFIKLSYDNSTMVVPYFLVVFKSKQEATRYQEKLDNGEIELPRWTLDADTVEGSTEALNIALSKKASGSYTPASFLKTAPTIFSAIVKNINNGDDAQAAMEKAENIFDCEQSDIMTVLMLDEFEETRGKIFAADEEPI